MLRRGRDALCKALIQEGVISPGGGPAKAAATDAEENEPEVRSAAEAGNDISDAQRYTTGKRKALRREGNFDEDGEAFKKAFDWQIMRRLLVYLRPYRRQLTAGIALLLAYSAVVPVFPYLIQLAIDHGHHAEHPARRGRQLVAKGVQSHVGSGAADP